MRLLVSPIRDEAVLSLVKSSEKGDAIYNSFITRNLQAIHERNSPVIVKGPASQYHIFIPFHYKDRDFCAVAEAFYSSLEDFRGFTVKAAHDMGLRKADFEGCVDKIVILNEEEARNRVGYIHSIIENTLIFSCGKGELDLQRQWSMAIMNLLANVTFTDLRAAYRLIIDSIIFLFNVDTAAIFELKNGHFYPEVYEGRLKDVIKNIRFRKDDRFVSNVYSDKKNVSILDAHELWHSGFPEDILSVHLFPLVFEERCSSFLGIFNSYIDKTAFDFINKFCRMVSFLCEIQRRRGNYENMEKLMGLVSLKILNLYSHYKDPIGLCEKIVKEASGLLNAEKCSLMLPDEKREVLRVSAVTGSDMWLMEGVKVRKGESIAGKVYESGMSLFVDREDKFKDFIHTRRPRYKTPYFASIPLKIADEVIGILNLSDKASGEPFSEGDLSIIAPFAQQASILLKLAMCHQTAEQMRELSITDPLTGLFNRRYFDIRIEEEYTRAKRYGLSFSLAIADIDDFKLFNDTEGHRAGDLVLREIASIMARSIRANDILVRFGGEEFAIIMPQIQKSEAFHVAERVRENIKNQIQPRWRKFPKERMTVSIGIAMYPESSDIESLIMDADKALYRAKRLGKDRTLPQREEKEEGKRTYINLEYGE
ncbi:MAG: diguanylate cyclase [Thermodesulfovibrionales bacterium]